MSFKISQNGALRVLMEKYGFDEARAKRAINIAWEWERNAEPVPGGLIVITFHGLSESTVAPRPYLFTIEPHVGKSTRERVVTRTESRYTQPKRSPITNRKEGVMPPKRSTRTKSAAAVEPEVNGEFDFDKAVERKFSPTMEDYIEWATDNLGDLDQYDSDRLLVLGIQMYSHFQKSDFNHDRREARRAAREAVNETEEPAKPTRGRKPPATAAKPATARRGARSGNGAKAPATASSPKRRARRGADAESPAATY